MSGTSSTSRVFFLRQRREELGLRRRELYAHDEDWPHIAALAEKLQKRRAIKLAKNKTS